MKDVKGKKRVIIENVYPEIDCGHFSIKRVIGEYVAVTADIFADGHNDIKSSAVAPKKRG
jgi:starch synthase (maltosyl-transferring)